MKVLLVDDEQDFRDTLAKRLARRGIEAETAPGAAEALAWLGRNPGADAVVLDVKMPGMDGIEALKHIAASYPGVAVLMLSGHAHVETAMKGLELGAFDYLMKPVDIEELVFKLQDACEHKALKGRA
ncbi:Response regulator receiver domain-containing protein [Humidesulfovibrio mexicanus]|uniref:Response regulator receiver domain-containing protein n=1 Tax=Humidesulfovibrio mexicanus TaxID=147047 RepID=A0A239CAS3_9BACT|nr:response regulator [Humidesulfovibrio mexicanus]SNS17002.1 Response regulator receiver domain-containing protein [Humidesulfovibrio mexicanus]